MPPPLSAMGLPTTCRGVRLIIEFNCWVERVTTHDGGNTIDLVFGKQVQGITAAAELEWEVGSDQWALTTRLFIKKKEQMKAQLRAP